MRAWCFFGTVLSWCALWGMFRCCATLWCVSDALYFTKKIIYNVSAFRVVDVRAAAECSNALLRSDFPHPFSEVLQAKNVTMPKAKKVKVNLRKLFKQVKSKKNPSSPKNRPTDDMKRTSCSEPDSDILIVFDSRAENTTAQQTVINIDCDDKEGFSVDCDMQHNTGTLHCSADSGPVGDICDGDVENSKSSELHPKNIPAFSSKVHVGEGTPKAASDSYRQTDGSEREMLKEKRCWQYTHFGSTLSVDELKDTPYHLLFTVMSYNVLAQDLLQRHPYLYYKNQPDALHWTHRSQILFSEIQEANADILCLQEVQANQLQSFYHQLNRLGYASLYKQRTGNNVDGVAIYYKRDVFELVDHTSVEYYQPGIRILDRHNVGLIAKLAIRANPNRYLVVATTHLLYNPNRHDIKLAQTQLLLAEVERMAFKGFSSGNPTYWPVIITGDMNFEPYTGVYRLLTEGMFQYEGLSNKRLTDSYGRALSKELLPRSLDILDTCQHWGILCRRAIEKLDYKTQLKFLKIYNTDHQRILKTNMISQTPTSFENLVENARMMELVNNFVPFFGPSSIPPLPDAGFATGQLTHNLNLCSVYTHGEKDNYLECEVTTIQDNWVTVDYVFYSCIKNESDNKISEGNLKLVSRYRLLTASEAHLFGPIPNSVSPSDHYPLLATFFYTF